MRPNILAPSILAADFSRLGDNISTVSQAGAQYLHIDVMDGKFVPSISFGMPLISSIRKNSSLVFDCHLMIEEPDRYIEDFKNCGADIITVHAEACTHLDRTLRHIKDLGLKCGVALNPATPLCVLDYVYEYCDMILLMSVNPGYGGQKLIPGIYDKLRSLRSLLNTKGLDIDVEVDGGININNLRDIVDAGANVIVAGSSIFKDDIAKNVSDFLEVLK